MNRPAAAFAVIAAVAIAAAGYAVGVQSGGLSRSERAAVEAMIRNGLSAQAPTTPVPAGAVETAELSDDQRAEVEAIIRNYLIANPEIIRDAIDELQRRADEAAQLAQTQAIADNSERIFSAADEIVLGNPDGDVTLVEFFDYNCTYCRRAQADMKQLIEKDPKLRVVLKEFPVLGDGSVQAAGVSIAVRLTAPDKFTEFHEALLGEKGQVDGDRALAVAEEIGLDPEVLRAKLDSDEVKTIISDSYDLAGDLNLTGTPSYVTKKEVIVGAVGYDALKAKIDDVRACATANC
jgi:protein-disulfide isomerase